MRLAGTVLLAAAVCLSAPASADSIASGPYWIRFDEQSSVLTEQGTATVALAIDAIEFFEGHAFFICSAATTDDLGDRRRSAVIGALTREGLRRDRIFDGGQCKPKVINRPVELPESVFVAMVPKDRVATYSTGRKSGTER